MKKILIIGRGFIGNSLSKYLKKKFKITIKVFRFE